MNYISSSSENDSKCDDKIVKESAERENKMTYFCESESDQDSEYEIIDVCEKANHLDSKNVNINLNLYTEHISKQNNFKSGIETKINFSDKSIDIAKNSLGINSKTFLIDSILGNHGQDKEIIKSYVQKNYNDEGSADEHNVTSTSACMELGAICDVTGGGAGLLAGHAYTHWLAQHQPHQYDDKNNRRQRRPGPERKPRQAYSAKQLERLESEFKLDKYLSVSKRMELSTALGLTEVQIKTWFQNRRTKWKKQLTSRLKIAQRQGLFPSQILGYTPQAFPLLNPYAYAPLGCILTPVTLPSSPP